jgi:hypothetical protein
MSSPEATPEPPEPQPEPQPEFSPPPTRPAWTRRLAPLILVGGLLAVGSILLPRLPKEREVEVRLEDAATVVGLDLAWTDATAGDGISLQGSSWRFAPGTAPRSLHTTVRLPDGAYALEITVDRTLGRDSTRRTIDLGASERITLPVR